MSQPGTVPDLGGGVVPQAGHPPPPGGYRTVPGDPDLGRASADVHAAYADVWTKAATFLERGIDLQGWTGEAADAANAKLAGMRRLMQAHAANLTEMATAQRDGATEADATRSTINAEKASSDAALPPEAVDLSGVYAGIAAQGVLNIGLQWMNGGTVVRASVAAGQSFAHAVVRDEFRTRQVMVARVVATAAFVSANLGAGIVSAAFFEGVTSFADDNSASFRAGRVFANAVTYIAGQATGYGVGTAGAAALGLTQDRGWRRAAVAAGAGSIAGALGGTVGPYVVTGVTRTPLPLSSVVGTAAAVGFGSGLASGWAETLNSAGAVLRFVGARIRPTVVAPVRPDRLPTNFPIGGGAYVLDDDVVVDIDGSIVSDTSYQSASSTGQEYYDAQSEAGDDPGD